MGSRAFLLAVDAAASKQLQEALEGSGLTVTVGDASTSGAKGLRNQDLVVLAGADSASLARLCQQVIASTGTPHPPILAIADGDDVESRVQLLEAGADDVLSRPIDQRELDAIVDALLLRSPAPAAQQSTPTSRSSARRTEPGRVIVFAAAKGGSGATSLAVNTALALAETSPGDVAIADLDMYHAQVATYLDVRPRSSTVELATDDLVGQSPESIAEAGGLHSSGLMVFGGPSHADDAVDVTPEMASALIDALRRAYGTLVIDAGSVFDNRTLTVLGRADRVAIVITPDIPALRLLQGALQVMAETGPIVERTVFVINQIYPKATFDTEPIEAHLAIKVGLEIPYDGDNFLKAANEGQPLLLAAPRSAAAQAIQRLAQKLSNGGAPDEEKAPRREKRGGLLGGLIGRN
jgi:pilus assembly protein CpaE